MKTLVAFTIQRTLCASAQAEDAQAAGQGFYPNRLIRHEGGSSPDTATL